MPLSGSINSDKISGDAVKQQIGNNENSTISQNTITNLMPVTISIEIATSNWVNKQASIFVSGISADSNIIVTPVGNSLNTWLDHGVECTGYNISNGKLDFICITTPTENLSINLVTLGSSEAAIKEDCLNFISASQFSLSISGNKNWDGALEYSTDDKIWKTWDGELISSEVKNRTNIIYLRGTNNTVINSNFSITSDSNVSCIGNIEFLLDYSTVISGAHPIMEERCFASLFEDCTSLISAPELPAPVLTDECYSSMFCNCTSLTKAPELPATTLSYECYYSMFENCTSLIEAPELPAVALSFNCYVAMFGGCTSLTKAPELPATTLATGCYSSMFYNCTSIIEAPELPATTLAISCYYNMFNCCTSLIKAPELPATTLTTRCYYGMLRNCTSLIEPPELPATTLTDECYSYMFNCCTSLTKAPELPATTLADECYSYMFGGCSSLNRISIKVKAWPEYTKDWVYGVSSSGTFICMEADDQKGTSAIPEGWVVLNTELDRVGGILYYIDNTSSSTYTFYNNNFQIIDTPTIGTDCTNLYYKVDNDSGKDKFFVFAEGTKDMSIMYKVAKSNSLDSTIFDYIGTGNRTLDVSKSTFGKGKSSTNFVFLDPNNQEYFFSDSIWNEVKDIRESKLNECNDWYLPTVAEFNKLVDWFGGAIAMNDYFHGRNSTYALSSFFTADSIVYNTYAFTTNIGDDHFSFPTSVVKSITYDVPLYIRSF